MPTIIKSKRRHWEPKREAHGRRTHTSNEYNTKAWRRDRYNHLSQNPYCVVCFSIGVYTVATVSDHRRRVRDGGDFWDWDNRQALCSSCHNKKSGREAHESKQQ